MKNLGISKSCPACKYTIFRDATFVGIGSINLKCPNCGKHFTVRVWQKIMIDIAEITISVIMIVFGVTLLLGTNNFLAQIFQ